MTSLLVASVLLGGCGSLRLHSDVRQKQGEDAAKAWKEVDLRAFFAGERENQAKLLETEIASWRTHVMGPSYENALAEISANPVSGYKGLYEASVRKLVLGRAGAIDSLELAGVRSKTGQAWTALVNMRSAGRTYELETSYLTSLAVPRFTCAQLTAEGQRIIADWKGANGETAARGGVDGGLSAARKACARGAEAQRSYEQAVAALKGGTLEQRARSLEGSRTAVLRLQGEVDERRIAYNDSLKAYEAEVEAKAAGRSTTEKVKEKAAAAKKALDALNSIAGVFGAEIASKERLERIDDLLTSLGSGEELNAEKASKVELAVSLLPEIADDLRAIQSAKKGHLAVPLLLQRDIEQAKLKSASARVAREQKAVVLYEELVRLTLEQLIARLSALDRVTTFHDDKAKEEIAAANVVIRTGTTLDNVLGRLPPGPRGAVLESTALYLDSTRRQELRIREVQTRVTALPMDESVDLAEINAGIWTSMIGATIEQAAEFSAMGIKAADIEKILGLIGVFFIGHGVNK